ncbi:MAG: inositol monophosphatase family protein [Desulfobaccales bacterium]
MNNDMWEQLVSTGRQAALAAGALLRLNYSKPHRITYKGAIDPVTESDLQSQELIVALIRRSFPDHGFLAEETAAAGGGEGSAPQASPPPASEPRPCRWIIDPLDGTVNFAHGFPAFCVSIALEVEGRLEYGVVYDPMRDELFEGRRGQGALLNGRAIQVSGIDRLDRALVATGFPYDIRERLPETLARLSRILGAVQGLRRAGAAALDMSYLACGLFDAFYEEHLKPWDTAAGLLLISEAGGRLTNFSGGPYDLSSPNILASNGILHDQLLTCLKEGQ